MTNDESFKSLKAVVGRKVKIFWAVGLFGRLGELLLQETVVLS